MGLQIEVVYENGVLRPLGPIPEGMREGQRFTVAIEGQSTRNVQLSTVLMEAAAREGDPTISLEEVRRILANVTETATEAVAAEREERVK